MDISGTSSSYASWHPCQLFIAKFYRVSQRLDMVAIISFSPCGLDRYRGQWEHGDQCFITYIEDKSDHTDRVRARSVCHPVPIIGFLGVDIVLAHTLECFCKLIEHDFSVLWVAPVLEHSLLAMLGDSEFHSFFFKKPPYSGGDISREIRVLLRLQHHPW